MFFRLLSVIKVNKFKAICCSIVMMCSLLVDRHFKEKMQQQTKKDEAKWKLLVSKVIAAKNALGPFSARPVDLF